jgi:phosphoserine aminotransferase
MAKKKSQLLYDLIDHSDGFYHNFIDEKFRSNINVFFRIGKTPEIEKKFIAEAKEKYNIQHIGGHAKIGGGS